MKSVLCLVFALVLGIVNARTVALWPLEARSDGKFNGVNLVNASDGLQMADGDEVIASDIGWEVPPNPDRGLKWCDVANRSCARKKGWSWQFLSNLTSGRLLTRDRNFTIEGWVKIHQLPANDDNTSGGKSFIIGANEPGCFHRWALMFCKGEGECSWQFWCDSIPNGDTVVKSYVGDEAIAGLTNVWIHVAVVHEVTIPADAVATTKAQETWHFYVNGEKLETTISPNNVTVESLETDPTNHFDLGGRAGNSKRIAYASFDYWRISDEALSPEAFLCAGGAGTQAAAEYEKTLAYWPLDVNRDGSINTWDALDGAPLASGFWKIADDKRRFVEMRPNGDAAFAGNPPNATVDLGADGNVGSLMGAKVNTALTVPGFGKYLTCTNDWTVEGWVKPRLTERVAGETSSGVLWGTRLANEQGWLFSLDYAVDGSVKFVLFADVGGWLQGNVSVTGDLRDWVEEWHHVALVHQADAGDGKGCWTIYLDGVQSGQAKDPRALGTDTPYGADFGIGGRTGSADYLARGFQGGIDCVRVSGAVLTPSQFMCTKDGSAANNVLALWPLNARHGAYFDLQDVAGTHHIAPADSHFAANLQAKPVADAERPVVNNPDPSTKFRLPCLGGTGGVLFRDAIGNTGARSCLVSEGRVMLDQMTRKEGWTFECYYNFTDNDQESGKQQVVFAFIDADGTTRVRFFMRNEGEGKSGWTISENSYHAHIGDSTYEGTTWASQEKGVWHHLAVTHYFVEEADGLKSAWRLFVDGVDKGVMTGKVYDSWLQKEPPRGTAFFVGGRSWNDSNSVRGMLSHVRVSKGILTPDEFLNASRADVPAPPTTLAYWPIDSVGGTVNGASLIAPAYDFEAGEGVTGQDAKARASVPRPDTSASLVGNAKANVGSVAATDGAALTAGGIGFGMELARSFTLEGWMKWTAGDAERDLLLRIGGDGEPGVKVWIETVDGQKKMRVRGRAEFPSSVLVNGVFDWDFTPVSGAWCHVALARAVDAGSWTLYVDGVEVGTVYDYWKVNATETFGNGDFSLLGSGAGTEFDMWRVTAGVRAPDAFLFDKVRGTLIFIK